MLRLLHHHRVLPEGYNWGVGLGLEVAPRPPLPPPRPSFMFLDLYIIQVHDVATLSSHISV